MRIARVGRRGTRIILGWLLAACLALGALHAGAAEQRYVYDELGRLIAVIDPAGETTHYTYDEAGNLTSVSRASSAQVSIAAFTPRRGRSGDAVSIFGTGFSATPGQNAVTFNGTPAVVTSSTTTSIVAVVPVAAASGPIHVTTPTGSATSAQPFTVVVPQPPQIAAFSPLIVAPNGTVVVAGSAFEPVPAENQVRVNTSTAVVIAATDESLTVRAPNATGGKVRITTPNGSASSASDLFIVPPPNAAADVAVTARIAIDAPGAALNLPQSKIGLVLFEGVADTAGVKVSVREASIASGDITVYAPNGNTLTNGSFGTGGITLALPTLPASGSYGVRVRSFSSGNATVVAWSDITGTLAYGVPRDLDFTLSGQQARLTFTAAAGDFAGIDVSAVTTSGGQVQVLMPNGAIWDTFSFGTAGLGRRIGPLNTSGKWTVIVTPSANGSVRLTLWKDVPGTLNAGALTDVTVAFPSQQVRMTFAGTVGQMAGVDISEVQGFASGNVTILNPNGQTWDSFSFTSPGGAGRRFGPLNINGNWTVVVVPGSSGTGTFKLRQWNDIADTLTYGTPYALSIPVRSQQARLAFTGAIGDFAGISLSDSNFPAGSTVTILNPNNQQVDSFPIGPGTASRRFGPLNINGAWTAVVLPALGSTGSAQVTVWKDVLGTLGAGVLTDVAIAYPQQQARMSFTGVAGQFTGLEVSDVQGFGGGSITILQPNGIGSENITFGTATISRRLAQLNASGIWTVMVTPLSSGTGTLKLRHWHDVTDPLTIGTTRAVSIPFTNQQARLPFTSTGGETLSVEVSGATFASGGTLTMIRPDGVSLVTVSFGSGASVAIPGLTVAGTYTANIVPTNSATGTMNVRVFRP